MCDHPIIECVAGLTPARGLAFMRGVYQHCGEKHLHRYLAEYDFRYNNRAALGVNDGERAALAVKKAAGKRLTYKGPNKP